MKHITLIIITFAIIIIALTAWLFLTKPWFKLAGLRLYRPMSSIIKEYSAASCQVFTPEEKRRGSFEALITGYCKPLASDFKSREDFLCAVGLNCSCPKGRNTNLNCTNRNGLAWTPCLDFNDTNTLYCQITASGLEPKPGFAAADWQCFTPNSEINIADKTYHIMDKGSAIIGRRFDLWYDNCHDALNAIGLYQVKIPN